MNIQQNKTLISIVLPTYNGRRWLAESIESVISQTFTEWELIIVNDCSTDDTLKIAENYANKDSRIRVISNQTNKKLPASLNVGFAEAHGTYLTWTSDDNLYKPNALAVMSAYLDTHPTTDMVSAGEDFINENGDCIGSNLMNFLDRSSKTLAIHNNVGAAFMYTRNIANKIGEYDENTFCAEDYDYWCRIALAGRLDYIDDNIYKYRFQNQSLTATKQEQIREKAKYITLKYKKDFIRNFNLSWWQQWKIEALVMQTGPVFILSRIHKSFIHYAGLILFFWNPKLRRKLRASTKIKTSAAKARSEIG
ncbi:hypothetical protein FACS1894186_2670 [Alphaproteobacteria bacterium]|nr:hypothetical protein FACS1894186_2670 [Alphaproteobacteria bacterium]